MHDTNNYPPKLFQWLVSVKQCSQNKSELNQELTTNAVRWRVSSYKNLYAFTTSAMQAAAKGINAVILSCILTKTFSLLTEADNTLWMGGLL